MKLLCFKFITDLNLFKRKERKVIISMRTKTRSQRKVSLYMSKKLRSQKHFTQQRTLSLFR